MHSYGQLNFSSDPKRTAAVGETYGSTITVNDTEAVLSCPVKPDWLKFELNTNTKVHDYGPPIPNGIAIVSDKNGNVYFPWIDPITRAINFAKISRDQSINYNWKKTIIRNSQVPGTYCEMNGYLYVQYIGLDLVTTGTGGVLNNFIVKISIDRPEQPEEICYRGASGDGANVWAIAAGKDGHIYMTSHANGNVIKVNPETGTAIDFCPINSIPSVYGVAVASDGSVYAQSYTFGNPIFRIPPEGGIPVKYDEYPGGARLFIDSNDNMYNITLGSGSNIRQHNLKTKVNRYIYPELSKGRIEAPTEVDGFIVFSEFGVVNAPFKRIGINAGLTGTPTTGGTFPVKIRATSKDGTVSKDLDYTITVKDIPKLSDFADLNGKVGDVITLSAPKSNSPARFSYSTNDASVATIDGNKLTFVGAGAVTVTATQEGNDTYFETSITCTASSKLDQTLTVDSIADKTYGDPKFTLPVKSSSGLPVSMYATSNVNVATINTISGEVTIVGAGQVTLYYDQYGNGQYNAAPRLSVTLNIKKADLIITADNKSKKYGMSNPVLTMSYEGFVNGEDASKLGAALRATTKATAVTPAGQYVITPAGAVSNNYNFIYTPGTLRVEKADLIITAENKSKKYGESNPALTVAYSGLVNGDTGVEFPVTLTTSVDIFSTPGSYPIVVNPVVLDNYEVTYLDGTLEVHKAPLRIKADDKTKVEGDVNAIPDLTISYSGFVNGDTPANLTDLPTVTTEALASSPAGNYDITFNDVALSDNYDIKHVAGVLSIGIATQTISFDPIAAKTYGDANFKLTAVSTNTTLPITYDSSNTAVAKVDPSGVVSITGAGTAIITARQAEDGDFAAAPAAEQILVVNKALLTITAQNKTKMYGTANPVLTLTYSEFANGETVASLTTPPVLKTVSASKEAGTYPITVSGAVSDNYIFDYVNGTLTVNKPVLTITVANSSKTYGTANPAFSVTYSGFVNGDTVASLSKSPTITTEASASSDAGTYPITARGAVADNYTVRYVNGTLTVNQAALTITVERKTRTYGAPNPTPTVVYSGFVNGDDAASITTPPSFSIGATELSRVGFYRIIASGAVSKNYRITYAEGVLAVTKALLTITAENKSKKYGAANPTLTVAYAGFLDGDTAADFPTIGKDVARTTADHSSAVGTYAIVPNPVALTNYDISYVNGTLTVDKAPLRVKADDKTKVLNTANPVLTISYTGFVNGDTPANLTQAATVVTNATAGSPADLYDITFNTHAVSDNYEITHVQGILSIGTSTQTISFDPIADKTYGDADFNLTAVSTNTNLPISYTSSNTAVATVDAVTGVVQVKGAGTAIITARQAGDGNFAAAPGAEQVLTVNKALLTITAEDQTKIYGADNPVLTLTYNGFVNEDKAISLVQQPVVETVSPSRGTGTYPITVSGAASENYILNYVNGTLTVSKATLTITATNSSRTYGAANPVLSVTYSGFVNGDTVASLSKSPTITTNATVSSGVGSSYTITASGAASNNYDIAYIGGTMTVDKAALVVKADDKTKAVNTVNPLLTITYTGFVNGNTQGNLTGTTTLKTSVIASTVAGQYDIEFDTQATSDNYDITFVKGIFKVVDPVLSVTFDPIADKTYGDPHFFLAATSSNSTLPIAYFSSNPDILEIIDNEVQIKGAGTATITARQEGNLEFVTATPVVHTLTVDKAKLIVTPDNQSKQQGAANPELTFTYSGFVNGDDESKLKKLPTAVTNAEESSPAGDYTITISGGESNNYSFDYKKGTLTIEPSLGTDEFDKVRFSYYPNPVKDVLHITMDKEIEHITVTGFAGQIVLEKEVHATQYNIDLSAFASGVYFVKVSTGKQFKIIKVIKI